MCSHEYFVQNYLQLSFQARPGISVASICYTPEQDGWDVAGTDFDQACLKDSVLQPMPA